MITIGLTGGIGSGKSTVAAMLREKGAAVIDADRVGHEVYRPGSDGWQEVVATFGQEVVATDGEIDRRRLAHIVFNDPEALRRLNAITHPRIKAMLAQRLEELRATGTQLAVVEAALLIEAGWLELVGEVWLTVVSDEVAIERLTVGGTLSRQQVESRMRSQLTNEERRQYAHVVIDNSSSLADVQRRVEELWAQVREQAEAQEASQARLGL
ncbi:MAG: dephospho-CoA kinase [Dehalococcoidia bacterium]